MAKKDDQIIVAMRRENFEAMRVVADIDGGWKASFIAAYLPYLEAKALAESERGDNALAGIYRAAIEAVRAEAERSPAHQRKRRIELATEQVRSRARSGKRSKGE